MNSKGVFIRGIDSSGEIVAENFSEWKKGIQKQLKRTKIRISGKNKVIFHNLIKTQDGGYQLIAETFSKMQGLGKGSLMGALINAAADEAGFGDEATNIQDAIDLKNYIVALVTGRFIGEPDPELTANSMTVQDFLVFSFNSDWELDNVRKIGKRYTKVYAYPPYATIGGLKLAKIMNSNGLFDYSFSRQSTSGGQILVYNSMLSSNPHVGVVNIEKGATDNVRKFEIKALKKYGEFNPDAENKAKDKQKNIRFTKPGATKGNDGKVVIYYIEKEKKAKEGTLKIFFESLDNRI